MAGPALTLRDIGECAVESVFTSQTFQQCANMKMVGKMMADLPPLTIQPPVQKIEDPKIQEKISITNQVQLAKIEQVKSLTPEDKKKMISEDVNMGTQIVFTKLDQAQAENDPEKKKTPVREAKDYMCMLNTLSSHPNISAADKETIRQMNQAYLEQVRSMNLGDPSLNRVMDPGYNKSGPFEIMEKMTTGLLNDPSLSDIKDRFF